MTDFKKLANVETIEEVTEEDTVLVVQGGEVKQAPKTQVGGNGEKTDLVLKFTSRTYGGSFANTGVEIESGSINEVMTALSEGRPPVVKVRHFYCSNPATDFPDIEGGVYDCFVHWYGELVTILFMLPGIGNMRIVFSNEDPDYLEVWAYPISTTTIQII